MVSAWYLTIAPVPTPLAYALSEIVNKLRNCIDLKRNCTKFLFFFIEIGEIVTSIFLQNYSIKNKVVIFYAQICVCAPGLLFKKKKTINWLIF